VRAISVAREGAARPVFAGLWDTAFVAKSRSILFFSLVAIAAALGGAMLARQLGGGPVALRSGTWLPQGRPVAEFSLTDQDGAPFDRARLEGSPSLLFFGFTHCPDVCPTTLALLAQLDQQPPVDGLRTILVSVDPERDDVETMRKYVRAFGPRMIGLTGKDEEIDKLIKSLGGARFRQQTAGGGWIVDHSATLDLLDARGRLAGVFSPPLQLPALRADLALAAEALER